MLNRMAPDRTQRPGADLNENHSEELPSPFFQSHPQKHRLRFFAVIGPLKFALRPGFCDAPHVHKAHTDFILGGLTRCTRSRWVFSTITFDVELGASTALLTIFAATGTRGVDGTTEI